MSSPDIEETVCPHCSAAMGAGEEICRRCGVRRDPLSAGLAAGGKRVSRRAARRRDWAERRGMLLVLLFLVLGPLALPMLWRSTKFSRGWKIVLTILVAIQTAAVIWLLWYVVHLFVESLREYGILEAS